VDEIKTQARSLVRGVIWQYCKQMTRHRGAMMTLVRNTYVRRATRVRS